MEKLLREFSNLDFICFSNSHFKHWLRQNLETNLAKAEKLIAKIRKEQEKENKK